MAHWQGMLKHEYCDAFGYILHPSLHSCYSLTSRERRSEPSMSQVFPGPPPGVTCPEFLTREVSKPGACATSSGSSRCTVLLWTFYIASLILHSDQTRGEHFWWCNSILSMQFTRSAANAYGWAVRMMHLEWWEVRPHTKKYFTLTHIGSNWKHFNFYLKSAERIYTFNMSHTASCTGGFWIKIWE